MSYIADLAGYLTNQGVAGTDTEWPLYTHAQPAPTGAAPTIPVRAATLYPTSGRPPPGRRGMEMYSGLQIRVRCERGADELAIAFLSALVTALHRITSQQIGQSNIRWIERDQSEPFSLGPDSGGRPEFTFNCTVVRGG